MTYLYQKPKTLNEIDHEKAFNDGISFFGLPPKVKFCKKCIISNQRPNSEFEYTHTLKTKKRTININEDGLCDACKYAAEKKDSIDWEQRHQELKKLCDKYRKNDGNYDCIVPGSGGKDSFYTSHILKYKYGMNPLTVTWAPHMYTPWGWKNMEAWSRSGFDNHLISPNRKVQKLLTRLAVENLYHPFQPFQFGQKFLAPRLAILHNIELIFYGEHMAEYGNSLEEAKDSKMDRRYFTSSLKEEEIFIGGVPVPELRKTFELSTADLKSYLPLTSDEVGKNIFDVHYLGYFMKWHPQGNYYYAVENGGFVTAPERLSGCYTKYNSIDDKMEEFNYYCQGVKFGLGWTSYTAAFEIRSGDLTRKEGVSLAKKYDHEFPERFIDDFLDYISLPNKIYGNVSNFFEHPIIDREYFENLTDKFRSPHIWKVRNNQKILRNTCWENEESMESGVQSASEWTGNKY